MTPTMAAPIDLRGLSPPEPMMRIFECLDRGPGPHRFLLSREPFPIYALLAAAGWRHATRQVEGGFEVTVHLP